MTRRHGRCPVGERCHDHAPGGHWKTMTFVAGLCLEGLVAPRCLDAPMNGKAFLAYVQTQLCPVLKQGRYRHLRQPGQPHGGRCAGNDRGQGCQNPLSAALFSRPQPHREVFSKIKTLLRKAAERSFDALWAAIGRIIETIRPRECRNYFANSGYVSN